MKIMIYELYTVGLEESEQFSFMTATGKIRVDTVEWIATGGAPYNEQYGGVEHEPREEVKLSGWAINRDGQLGFVRRKGDCAFLVLPEDVRTLFKDAYQQDREMPRTLDRRF